MVFSFIFFFFVFPTVAHQSSIGLLLPHGHCQRNSNSFKLIYSIANDESLRIEFFSFVSRDGLVNETTQTWPTNINHYSAGNKTKTWTWQGFGGWGSRTRTSGVAQHAKGWLCVWVSRVLRVTNERLLALVVLPNPITIHTVYSAFVIILSMMTATAHYGCYILLCCIQYLYLGWSYLIVWPVVRTVCER